MARRVLLAGGVKESARTAGRTAALLAGLALAGCGSVADAAPEPEGVEMSVFRVPSRHGLAPSAAADLAAGDGFGTIGGIDADETGGATEAARAATVMMPPDVVARPGEEPDEALDRALADGALTDEALARGGRLGMNGVMNEAAP